MQNFQADFMTGASEPKFFPKHNYPEIAFSGRSNVGKSSLLNSIVNRKNLAHTSSMPGKTQQINFFNIEGKWVFADLPGFGYAAIGKKHRELWRELNLTYLAERENLILTCVLIDSRHDPMDNDLALIEWLEHHKKHYLIILTKIDKIKEKQLKARKQQIEELISLCSYYKEVLPYSSVKNIGRNELVAIIKKMSKTYEGF